MQGMRSYAMAFWKKESSFSQSPLRSIAWRGRSIRYCRVPTQAEVFNAEPYYLGSVNPFAIEKAEQHDPQVQQNRLRCSAVGSGKSGAPSYDFPSIKPCDIDHIAPRSRPASIACVRGASLSVNTCNEPASHRLPMRC